MASNNINLQPMDVPTAILPFCVAAHVVPGRPDLIRLTLPNRDRQLYHQEMTPAQLQWLVDYCSRVRAAEKTAERTAVQPTTPPAPTPDAAASPSSGSNTPNAPVPGFSPQTPIVLDDE
ncbi:hypothetical protein BZA77DRAFT_361941 [Pyronema omphalodes]|nr:hypothetical protein BZA77DRAFT_361941 [Pyronema omphalodes]